MLIKGSEEFTSGIYLLKSLEILKLKFDFSFIIIKYPNMKGFGLSCWSEFFKEVTSFKLELNVYLNFIVLGSNPQRGNHY